MGLIRRCPHCGHLIHLTPEELGAEGTRLPEDGPPGGLDPFPGLLLSQAWPQPTGSPPALPPVPSVAIPRGVTPGGYSLGWPLGCLVLLLVLLLQSAWWVRGDLLSSSLAHRLLDGVCQMVGCPIPLPRRSDQLVVSERYLGPHPEQADQWQLRLGLRNPDPIPLALPVIEVELYDLREHLISVGRFIPEQYADPASPQAIAPHTEISLSLLLQAPLLEPSGFRLHLR